MKQLFFFLATSFVISCGNSKIYPEQVKENFVKGCAAKVKGNTALCDCLFEKIQDKYSFNEYVKMEEQMKAGQTSQEFLHYVDSVTLGCYKETKK